MSWSRPSVKSGKSSESEQKQKILSISVNIPALEAVYYGKPFRDSEVAEVFLYTKPVNTEKLTLQKSEVESVRWMPFDALYSAVKEGTIPNCIYLSELDMMKRYLSGVRG